MANRAIGEELGQISGFLFDSAARKWYVAAAFEVVAGALGSALAITSPTGRLALVAVGLGFALLALAHGLRLWSESQYDLAETIRRQAVITDGLDWTVNQWQLDKWRTRAGSKIRQRVRNTQRDSEYFGTRRPPGAQRLADMTTESAFYTWQIYDRIRVRISIVLLAVLAMLLFVILFTALAPYEFDEIAVSALYTGLPALFAVDLIGWYFRLGRTTAGIENVLIGLEDLENSGPVEEHSVLQFVSEYNNQLTTGIPISDWLFKRWHEEITEIWKLRICQQ